jgi:hypothetical protein
MTVLAHGSAHWLESAVYLIPIVGFALWLAFTTIKDRRSRRNDEGDADSG